MDKRALFRIKAATRDLVDRLGGIERAADLVDYGKSTVHRWISPDHPDVVPLMSALIMEAEVGDAFVTKAMVALNGLVTADPGDATTDACITVAHLNVTREVAELMTGAAIALSDGRVTPHEARGLDEQAADVQQALETLRGRLATHANAGGAT